MSAKNKTKKKKEIIDKIIWLVLPIVLILVCYKYNKLPNLVLFHLFNVPILNNWLILCM